MQILIDGYNLLHATGIVGDAAGPATLARSRTALLRFLAAVLDEPARSGTWIVFDARSAPPGLESRFRFHDMTVRFAPRDMEADDLIARLVEQHSAPRRLLVVSSDHRVQRFARRRRASVVDSEVWYADVRRRHHGGGRTDAPRAATPRLSAAQIAAWLAEFGDVDQRLLEAELIAEDPVTPATRPSSARAAEKEPKQEAVEFKDGQDLTAHDGFLFPPGYAEDVLRNQAAQREDPNPFPPGYGEDVLDKDTS